MTQISIHLVVLYLNKDFVFIVILTTCGFGTLYIRQKTGHTEKSRIVTHTSGTAVLLVHEWGLILVWFMAFNATFNKISVISRRSVLLVEKTGVPGETHRPVPSHWQTLSHNVVSSCIHEWNIYIIRVSELLNPNSAIFQLYHGENKLIFNEMMMTSALL